MVAPKKLTLPLEEKLRKLVQEHRQLKDEPLLLAAQIRPARASRDVLVFEIADHFGADSVDPKRKLFEVSYGNTPGFPLEPGQNLRLVLTNPREWERALKENWPGVKKLRNAYRAGGTEVLFATSKGRTLWEKLHG